MKKILIVVLLSLVVNMLVAQDKAYEKTVNKFIHAVQKLDKEYIASTIHFPFRMNNPARSISNKKEFIRRFNEVFPPILVQKIIRSHASTHWGAVGSKGIMFLNGEVWLDIDGSLMAVNYKSKITKQARVVKKSKLINIPIKNLITNSSAGTFKLNSKITSLVPTDDYKIKKVEDIRSEEGENYTYITYVVNDYKEDLLEISEDASTITVVSNKFKTSKGIGVGSTIEEFIKAYPTYKIWYTYISDMCVIQTKTGKIQFILDNDDLKSDPPCNGEIDYLKKSDFNKNSKIIKIRIF